MNGNRGHRRAFAVLTAVGLAFWLTVSWQAPATAAGAPDGVVSGFEGDAAAISAQEQAQADAARYNATAAFYAANPYVYSMVPACFGNSPATGGDALCQAAVLACPPGQVLFWLYRAPEGTTFGTGAWDLYAQRCQAPPTPGAAPLVVPGLSLEDFQRLPLPPGITHIQPDNGYTLINVPTNVYADANPVTLNTTLLGFDVAVRATPATYTWNFGDGTTTVPSTDPGAPYPDLRTTHTYTEPGPHDVTLTTACTGEYSVASGPWLPVPGQAQVDTPPVPVDALAGHNRLVADTLND